jgi:hypothetical protein
MGLMDWYRQAKARDKLAELLCIPILDAQSQQEIRECLDAVPPELYKHLLGALLALKSRAWSERVSKESGASGRTDSISAQALEMLKAGVPLDTVMAFLREQARSSDMNPTPAPLSSEQVENVRYAMTYLKKTLGARWLG